MHAPFVGRAYVQLSYLQTHRVPFVLLLVLDLLLVQVVQVVIDAAVVVVIVAEFDFHMPYGLISTATASGRGYGRDTVRYGGVRRDVAALMVVVYGVHRMFYRNVGDFVRVLFNVLVFRHQPVAHVRRRHVVQPMAVHQTVHVVVDARRVQVHATAVFGTVVVHSSVEHDDVTAGGKQKTTKLRQN